jgi:predicted aspartyl protease
MALGMKIKPGIAVAMWAVTTALTLAAPGSSVRETAASVGSVSFDGAVSYLALQDNQAHPRVRVDLGDDAPHPFIVDTGASVNVMDSSIAASQGYKVVGGTEIGAPGGPQIAASIVSVPLLRVGDVTIRDAEFVTMDVIGFSAGSTHGVLGVGLFTDFLVAFDRGAGHIRLSRESLSADEPGVLAYDPANSQIGVEIRVAGVPVQAHVDTGSMGEFMLPGEMMQSLPLQEAQTTTGARLVVGERDIRFAQLEGNIQLADLQFENPTIAFMTPAPHAGNIGSGILSNFQLLIDQKNRLIAFRKTAAPGVAVPDARPRRLGVQFQGTPGAATMTIARVMPGSLGERAGLLADDVLVAINNISTGEYDMAAMGSVFESDAPLELDIERGGERITIDIP